MDAGDSMLCGSLRLFMDSEIVLCESLRLFMDAAFYKETKCTIDLLSVAGDDFLVSKF